MSLPIKEGHVNKVFMKMVNKGWQALKEVEPYVMDNFKVIHILQQSRNYECGHHILHYIILYVKVLKLLLFHCFALIKFKSLMFGYICYLMDIIYI